MIIGSICWCKSQQRLFFSKKSQFFNYLSCSRFERDNNSQCKGMMVSFTTNTFLLMFEISATYNLEYNNLLWVVCFVQLLALSQVSTRHSRFFEIELFCVINILQFVFIALRLDNIITWSWAVSNYIINQKLLILSFVFFKIVFIPLWITNLVLIIILVYLIIISIILSRSQISVNNTERTNKWNIVFAYIFFTISVIIFEVKLLRNFLSTFT